MLKLLKYEFRKGLTLLLIMLGVTAALEGYFLYSLMQLPYYTPGIAYSSYDTEIASLGMACGLLLLMSVVIFFFVLVRGVSSYSGELRKRSAYLIFMTPNSTLKIVASKFLFTLLLTLAAICIYGALGFLDLTLLMNRLGEMENFLEELSDMLLLMGVNVQQIVLGLVIGVLMICLYVLNFCAVAYLAITLSHTIFRDKGWRWLVALLFFFVINYGLSAINGLFDQPFEQLTILQQSQPPTMAEMEMRAAEAAGEAPTRSELLVMLIPQTAVSICTVVGSLFGCAWMLKKKVSL